MYKGFYEVYRFFPGHQYFYILIILFRELKGEAKAEVVVEAARAIAAAKSRATVRRIVVPAATAKHASGATGRTCGI